MVPSLGIRAVSGLGPGRGGTAGAAALEMAHRQRGLQDQVISIRKCTLSIPSRSLKSLSVS